MVKKTLTVLILFGVLLSVAACGRPSGEIHEVQMHIPGNTPVVLQPVNNQHAFCSGRITSYNVCYTKLLRLKTTPDHYVIGGT